MNKAFHLLLGLSILLMVAGATMQFTVTHQDLMTERVSFLSADESVSAILVRPKGEGPFPGIILLHGYGSRKELVLPTAIELAKAGFITLIPDLRGHGESRLRSDFGGRERFDTTRAIDYLISRNDVESSKMALMGSSFGGMNAIIAGGIDSRVNTVVSSSSPSNLSRWLAIQDWDGEERHSFVQHTPIDFENIEEQNYRSPIEYVSQISAILIFHGGKDSLVPVNHAHELFSHASNDSKLRIIEGAEHDLPREIVLPETIEWLGAHLDLDMSKPGFPIGAYLSILGMSIFYIGFGLFIMVVSGLFHALVPKTYLMEATTDYSRGILRFIALWGVGYVFVSTLTLVLVNETSFGNVTLSSLLLSKLALGIIIAAYLWSKLPKRWGKENGTNRGSIFAQRTAHFAICLLCILCIWLFHSILAFYLYLPFSDLCIISIFPEIYFVIVIAAVIDEFWFRQVAQRWILARSGSFCEKKIIVISASLYAITKLSTTIMIELYFNLLSIRWLLAIFVAFLFIGTAGAFLKEVQGLWASSTFSILVHTTIYVALTFTILL